MEPREFTDDEIELLLAIAAQVAQTIEHAKLYSEAQRRVGELEALARISEAVSESLYLEESLEAIVQTTVDAVGATGAALVLEDGNIAWPEGRAATHAIRIPLRWKGRQIGELVCDRDTPFTDQERALLSSIANHAAVALEHGRAVMRGVLAQEIHHRVKNNLQTVASLLRLQARSGEQVDPRKALDDSANRILAIAAVHEVLTESRHDDVDLDELLDRLRAMLVQGLGSGKRVETALEPVSLAGDQATALALVFSELLQNALEHGGDSVRVELGRRAGRRARDRGRRRGNRGRAFRYGPVHRRGARPGRAPRHARPDLGRRHAGGGRLPGMRILVAEDETIIRLDLRNLLEESGHEVCAEARDGQEAVELAREHEPDLAILDVKMPRLDGIEAARRILEERPIPIVMLTAYGQDELVSRAVEAGVFGYLVKPFREADLLPAIATARARHEELASLREEADSLAEALAARKAIERAKGLLMERDGLSEEEAFKRLRKASQLSGKPLKVVAEALIALDA